MTTEHWHRNFNCCNYTFFNLFTWFGLDLCFKYQNHPLLLYFNTGWFAELKLRIFAHLFANLQIFPDFPLKGHSLLQYWLIMMDGWHEYHYDILMIWWWWQVWLCPECPPGARQCDQWRQSAVRGRQHGPRNLHPRPRVQPLLRLPLPKQFQLFISLVQSITIRNFRAQ